MKAPLNVLSCVVILLLSSSGWAVANIIPAPADTLNLEEAVVEDEDGEVHYELVIFDPGFHHWFARTGNPPGFYNQSYLEDWNKRLVNQWNQLYHSSRACRPEVYLKYDPDIDYGLELNHKLFYYFRYMHERCRMFTVTPGRW